MIDAFVVRMHREPRVVRLVLSGELDLGFLGALDASYRRATAMCGPLAVVVDVSGLDFCDLLGQRALLRYHGSGATLVGARPCLHLLFGLTGQQHLLPIDPSLPWPVAPLRVFEAGGAAPRRAYTFTITREARARPEGEHLHGDARGPRGSLEDGHLVLARRVGRGPGDAP